MSTLEDHRREEAALPLRVLVKNIWLSRQWLAVCTIGFAAVSVALILILTPVYRASVVLLSASSDRSNLTSSLGSAFGQLGGLASIAGVNLGVNNGATEEALAVLRSRQFTEQFIDDFILIPVLYYKKWDTEHGRWKPLWTNPPTIAKAVKYFREKVESVSQDKKTGLITVQVTWKDRRIAAEWANNLVSRLNREMRKREIEKAEASITFLEKELSATAVVATHDAISRLIEAQEKQRMIANVTQDFAFRVVDKAVTPDEDDPVAPSKAIFLIAGPLLGFSIGLLSLFIFGPIWRSNGKKLVGPP